MIIVVILFGENGFLSSNNKTYDHVIKIDKSFVNNMVLKNPIISKIDDDLTKKKEAESEKKLVKRRKELKSEREKIESKKDKRKIAYLTFDDGPSEKSTPRILDILKEHDVPATFFVLGQMADNNPDILKRLYEEGHAIGHHSYSHNYGYIYGSANNFMSELSKTEKSFKRILGEDFESKLLRLPGGSFGEEKQTYVNIASMEGYKNYNWNALNGDSEGHNMEEAYLIDRLKSTVGNKKEVIILMHDTDAKMTTVNSLSDSIEYLKEKGYEFRKLGTGDV